MVLTTTPKEITNFIIRNCKKFVPKAELLWIDVIPEEWCLVNECFANVKAKVNKDGGVDQLGWKIWEWENVMIEAEYHSVWRSPENMLIDITPQINGERKTLFLIDETRYYDGSTTDNMRFPLSNDKLVNDYIKIAKMASNYLYNNSEINKDKLKEIYSILNPLQTMIENGENENSECFCKSGKKYKNCHSKKFV